MDIEEGITCTICLDLIGTNKNIMIVPECNHSFHASCFLDYIEHSIKTPRTSNNLMCPMCRKQLLKLKPDTTTLVSFSIPPPPPPMYHSSPIPPYDPHIDSRDSTATERIVQHQRQMQRLNSVMVTLGIVSLLCLIFSIPSSGE